MENETVGNPVRADIAALPVPAIRMAAGRARATAGPGRKPGARAINESVPRVVASFPHRANPPPVRRENASERSPPTQRRFTASSSLSSPTWPQLRLAIWWLVAPAH